MFKDIFKRKPRIVYDDYLTLQFKRQLQIYYVKFHINWRELQLYFIGAREIGEDTILYVDIRLGSPGLFFGSGGLDMERLREFMKVEFGRDVEFNILEHNVWE